MSAYHHYRQFTLCGRTYKDTHGRTTRAKQVRERLEIMFPMEVALLRRQSAFLKIPVCSHCGQKVPR
jgi:hypothetical protein